jgi:SAM-dependent methyltransferase
MLQDSLDATYFENIYAESDDPWHFATSAYEAQKYAATIEMLGPGLYARGLEIGCSIGVLSRMLAERCHELISVDISPRALASARERCADRANVQFELADIPKGFPAGPFDLVVLSEVAYYWSDEDLALARRRIAAAGPRGTLVLVHYLPKVEDYVRDGDAVHESFLRDPRFERRRSKREKLYRIDVLAIR